MAVTSRADLAARRRAQKKRQRRAWLILILLLLLLMIGGFFYAANHERLAIKEIVVTGTKSVSAEAVERAARAALAGRYFRLVRRDNMFLYPRETLRATLLAEFDKLASVESSANYDGRLRLMVAEREAVAMWCTSATSTPCSYLDAFGLAFTRAPMFSGPVMLEVVASRPAITNTVPMPSATFRHLRALANTIPTAIPTALLPRAESIRAELLADNDIRLWVKDSSEVSRRAIPLLMSLTSEPEVLAENLRSAFATPSFLTEIKNRRADLEYLDLRFTDKVFYKFRENLL